MSLRGLLAGTLLLAGLEVVVSSNAAASRFGGLLTSVSNGVRYFLDPAVPAIPDRRKPASSGGGGLLNDLGNLGSTLLSPFDPAAGWAAKQLSYQRHAPTPATPTVTA